MKQLADTIWKEGGFRFFHRSTQSNLRFVYHCCQDQARERKLDCSGSRDTSTMTRFPCQSSLTMHPLLEDRILLLELRHRHHEPYFDRQLSTAATEFVDNLVETSTPAEIFRKLAASSVPEASLIPQYQVYYRWQKANMATWRRDPDPILSAKSFLCEKKGLYDHQTYASGSFEGIAFYIRRSITTLVSKSRELAMDATYGTNSSGMDLYSVLAEVDGAGIPLAYCFVQVAKSGDTRSQSNAGALSRLLNSFLRPLRDSGFKPAFFGVDKDTAEISAARLVWPEASIQLCYWHSKRAIRAKLKDSKKTNSQLRYFPDEAKKLIPELKICWGSLPTRRPDGEHRYGRCLCPSRAVQFEEKGRTETSTTQEQETVLRIFSRHFNSHPLIPDANGSYRTGDAIHRESAGEIYRWCYSRNYFRLWAYLWTNWYCPGQWELWARATNSTEIPKLKTTMIVESHWRRIKHDYLHRFNRPRIDLVVWILTSRVIPDAMIRMDILLNGGHRRVIASWRKAFKQEWKKLAARECDSDSCSRYHTNPQSWVCGCYAFLESRFLICHHLVHCFQPISKPVEFFAQIRRKTTAPFWVHKQLIPKSEFGVWQQVVEVDGGDDWESDVGSEAMESEAAQLQALESEAEDRQDDDASERIGQILLSAQKIHDDQKAKGNKRFLGEFAKTLNPLSKLIEEITSVQNQRSMPKTWAKYKEAATRYYK